MNTIEASSPLKRVALFSTNFVFYSQTFVFDEIAHHERYEIDVFCHNRLNAAAFPWSRVYALHPASSPLRKLEWALYGLTTYSPSHMARIRTGGYDVLHAHFGPGGIYALTYKKAARSPLVVTFHGYDVPLMLTSKRFLPAYWRYWWRFKALVREVDCFLAASDELSRLLVRLGAPEEKVNVHRLGVQIPPCPRPGPKTGQNILMAGRFVEKKGFEFGLQAVGSLLKSGVDCHVHIIGDGPRRSGYDRLIAELGIMDRVHFHGIMPHRKVLDLMDGMDILLAPSVVAAGGDRESGLMVAKEASARSIPVVGTRHGGIPEIVDHLKTGLLVPERDPEALAAALATLLGDEALRNTFGCGGRAKMIAEYDIVDRVRALEARYDDVIAAHAMRPCAERRTAP